MKPGKPLGLVIVLACMAQLMVVLDGLIVSVALPDIGAALGLSAIGLQWVVSGYLVTVGSLLLLAARTADVVGHRRVFVAGLSIFTLASLAGGLAPNGETLIAARVIQGAGAAALAPTSLSLLTLTHEGQRRPKALSIWSATSASAGALGLVLGGVITSGLGWRWVLLVNVPIGIGLWVLASSTLAPTHSLKSQRIDLLGAVSITITTGALTFAISHARAGWGSMPLAAGVVVTAVFLGLFIASERRASEPLIPLGIFRHRNLVIGNLALAALGAVMTATVYFLSLYQQHILAMSPLQTGLALLPMSTALTVGALASQTLIKKYGTRKLIVAGSLTMAAGLTWLSEISPESQYLIHILGPTLVWGLGASIVTMPCVALATADADPTEAGLASGLVNTARQVGGATGLAILAAVAGATADPTVARSEATHGYSAAFLGSAAISIIIAAAIFVVHSPNRNSNRPPGRNGSAMAQTDFVTPETETPHPTHGSEQE